MPVLLFFLLSTSLFCVFMALLPGMAMIPAIIWGGLLIMAGLYLELRKSIIIYFINISILLFAAGTNNFLVYFTFFGIAAMIMTLLSIYGKDYYHIQQRGIIAAVLGVSIFLMFSYLSTGGIGIEELESELNQSAAESIGIYEQMGIFDIYERMGVSQEEFENSLRNTTSVFARHLPAIFYNQAIITVFFMLLLASYLSRKQNIERLKKKSYREESMPWQLVWIAIGAMGLWIWGRDDLNYIYYTGSNILWIIVPIAIYYGFSTIVYKISEHKQSTRVYMIIGLILMLIIFPLSAIIFVSIIGLFDSLVDFRKLRMRQEDE